MPWAVLSISVRRMEALLVCPVAIAVSSKVFNDSNWERRWIVGHKSVAAPRRLSTSLNGESSNEVSSVEKIEGATFGGVLVLGGVPSERAAITSKKEKAYEC